MTHRIKKNRRVVLSRERSSDVIQMRQIRLLPVTAGRIQTLHDIKDLLPMIHMMHTQTRGSESGLQDMKMDCVCMCAIT
jgi:hypothetical protein